jgi:hypothetical protein
MNDCSMAVLLMYGCQRLNSVLAREVRDLVRGDVDEWNQSAVLNRQ